MQDATAQALRAEMERARSLFPSNEDLSLALMEEVGEVAKAMIEGGDYGTECLHVACVALRLYEEGEMGRLTVIECHEEGPHAGREVALEVECKACDQRADCWRPD